MSEFFLKNFWLKMASLVLATLIWLTVQANLDKEMRGIYPLRNTTDELMGHAIAQRRMDLPVTVLSDGVALPGYVTVPAKVSVTLSGEAQRVNGLDEQEVSAFVETAGTPNNHDLYPVIVTPPTPLSYLRVQPQVVRLRPVVPPRAPSPP